MTEQAIAIIGAGHAGVHAAATLRNKGAQGPIYLIDQQSAMPYERPPLSKDVLLNKSAPALLRKENFYADRHIMLITGTRVETIDRSNGSLRFADGRNLSYDRLLIATGSHARTFPVPGAHLKNVTTLRTVEDSLRIRQALKPGANIVVIGAGYVGMEVAAAAAMAQAKVHVIEQAERVLRRVTSIPISQHFQQLHMSHGVSFLLGRSVLRLEGDTQATRVVTAEGDYLDADHVIVGTGVLPEDRLAKEAGLLCDDGILVDEYCRTSDPRIYAAGDVARALHPIAGKRLRIESIPNALAQADIAAAHMLGQPSGKRDVPWFWSNQYSSRLQSAGIQEMGDQIVLRGNSCDGRFSVLYLRDGRLAAIDAVDSAGDFMAARKIIMSLIPVNPDFLVDPAHPLSNATL